MFSKSQGIRAVNKVGDVRLWSCLALCVLVVGAQRCKRDSYSLPYLLLTVFDCLQTVRRKFKAERPVAIDIECRIWVKNCHKKRTVSILVKQILSEILHMCQLANKVLQSETKGVLKYI